ncbi:hypothetical protein DPEC_G00359100 [Dallia pectoralis]|uniref:Uncharacterized protein n=1 Tax=Dallia pectoralis TaxID=75939 RepID=A0ACC2F0V3_DALPE|nr:hypothetical protein DPEC_G00359100 [Dallia pectoralis]
MQLSPTRRRRSPLFPQVWRPLCPGPTEPRGNNQREIKAEVEKRKSSRTEECPETFCSPESARGRVDAGAGGGRGRPGVKEEGRGKTCEEMTVTHRLMGGYGGGRWDRRTQRDLAEWDPC